METANPARRAPRAPLQRLVVGFLQWPFAVALFHWSLKRLFGLRLHGGELVPARRPLLFVANHGSHFDGLFLRVIGREIVGAPVASVAWGGVRLFPFAKAALAGRAFAVVLTNELANTAETRAGVIVGMIDNLQAGRSVAVNAEGDRYERLAPFRPGAAFVALETGTPIVPITLRGVQPLWPTLPWPRRWWGRVEVHIHPPIDPADYADLPKRAAVAAITDEARRRIASLLDYPDSLEADPGRRSSAA